MQYYLAVDIGASSGRHILGWVEDGIVKTEEIHRFDNKILDIEGTLCWDIDSLFSEIISGMKKCSLIGKIPTTMGIDTWAVDYVLLDANGERLTNAVCYRDDRTTAATSEVEKIISFKELYSLTGIQRQKFNTIYQLMAQKLENSNIISKAEHFLMIPEYLNYKLTGIIKNEYTNATSTAMVNAKNKDWDKSIIEKLGYPEKIFGELNMPGTLVGKLTDQIKNEVGYSCEVILPATHDTGSAFLSVPARDDKSVYISSGTWSLLGVENENPILTDEAKNANFTNEGGYQYRFRFLKNIMGLWMIQQIRREYNKKFSFDELEKMARDSESFESIVNVNDDRFLAPESMIQEVKNACADSGQKVPENTGELMQCVYGSLAFCYAQAIKDLQEITGKEYDSINIVGGGSQDGYLNELTSKATGLPVYAGPVEGTVIGNLIVQMISGGEFKDLSEARKSVLHSFKIAQY